jgi:tetratricopeptide (TPR) repeat protein
VRASRTRPALPDADKTKVELTELEALVGSGCYGQAIDLGLALLNRATTPYRLAHISYHLAMAYLQLAQTDHAEPLLAKAHSHFVALDDRVMLAECMGSMACLAYLTQRPEAVALAQRALELCRSLKPVPAATEARLLYVLAGAHMTNEELDKAILSYLAAIKAAGQLVDLRRLGKMYGDLGGAYRVKGDLDAALAYGTRSVQLLEALRDEVSLARSENNLGLILMARGDLVGARKHLDRSLHLAQESGMQVGRSHVLLSLCEVCLEQDDIDQAGDFAQEALALAEKLSEALNVAEAHIWLGRVADRRGDHAAVDREFHHAMSCLERHGTQEKLLQSHGTYAEILEQRGDIPRAYAHMKKALQAGRPGILADNRLDGSATTA